MVEGVEEFGAELDRMILHDPDPFQNSDIPVELAGAENNTSPRIAVVRFWLFTIISFNVRHDSF